MTDASPPLVWSDVGHSGSLTDYSGSNTIETANATIENRRFTAALTQGLAADNLTVRNCHFDMDGDLYAFNNTYNQAQSNNLLIEDCTFEGTSSSAFLLGGSGVKTLRRCRWRDNLKDHGKIFSTGNVILEDSYFGPYSRTEAGQIDYDALTSAFSVGERITGSSSGSSATIISIETSSGTTGTLYYKNPSNGISATVYFQDNETLTGDGGGSATANGAGSFEDFHSDGIQMEGPTPVTLNRVTWDLVPSVGGVYVEVTPGSWLEATGIAAGIPIGQIYYKGTITYFVNDGAGAANVAFNSCHFVGQGSNGVQLGAASSTATFTDCRFYPSRTYFKFLGSGTHINGGGNVWAEAGTTLLGQSVVQFEDVFNTGVIIDPPSDWGSGAPPSISGLSISVVSA